VPFLRKCGKILYSGEAIDDSNADAHFMLDTRGDWHTLRILFHAGYQR
jgi:hypothetical protein